MTITVEFYGVARRRAGLKHLVVQAATLGEALDCVSAQLPAWAEACIQNGQLAGTFLANRNGHAFLMDRDEPLAEGDSLLILSADVGG